MSDGNQEQKLGQTTYGGCEGPESEYIKIISSDRFEFIIKREIAFQSETIKDMVEGPVDYAETDTTEVYLQGIQSHTVFDVCRYFYYKVKYTDSHTEIPDFDITEEAVMNLFLAATFFRC